MNPIIKTIPRDAGDTSKGYTLQKLRTISLVLTEIQQDHTVDFIAAVEFNGDVFLDTQRITYVEEDKAYDSKNFSFASEAVKNTMCYFLDYWLNNHRDTKMRFGFYATNQIVKEIVRGDVKKLNIKLPKRGIIEYLKVKDYDEPDLLPAVKTLILSEYRYQYENNKNHTLAGSHFETLANLTDIEWKSFLNIIDWVFDNEQIEDLEKKIILQIGNIKFETSLIIKGKEPYIRAELFYQLELRQNKKTVQERFLDRREVELIFYRAVNNINDESYKYLSLDYDQLKKNTEQLLNNFVNDKYFAISGLRRAPTILSRKVGLFDPSLRIESKKAMGIDISNDYSIQGYFNKVLNTSDPVFLFGELGSGKSTIVANYLLTVIAEQPDIIPVFLASGYLQDKPLTTLEEIILVINQFVNNELPLTEKIFDLNTIFKTNKEIVIVFDGLDELPLHRARQLVTNLKRLQQHNKRVKIIATGRPVELEGILPVGWHALITLPLNDNEITTILTNEAIAHEISNDHAMQDANVRLSYLKRRPELYAIAKNPLVLCSVWVDLNESLGKKTLGDLLYNVIQRRLDWHEKDNKAIEEISFFKNFPSIYDREVFLKIIARDIFFASDKAITDAQLNRLVSLQIGDVPNKRVLINSSIQFFKATFLQKTNSDKFGFVSSPLLECALGLEFCDILLSGQPDLRLFEHWRSLAFSLAIARSKGLDGDVKNALTSIMASNLTWPDNNIAQTAIILAEYQNNDLCKQFIENIAKLGFRPISTLEQNDPLTTYAVACCMHLAGDMAFDWFWNEYLNCENPLIHYQSKLAADILAQYLIINNFHISLDKQQRLESIVKPNLQYSTSLCYEILPVIATITQNGFSVKERCLLLVGLINTEVLHLRATELLFEISHNDRELVLNAIESICKKDRNSSNLSLPKLWFQLNKSRDISKDVLSSCIKAINPSNHLQIIDLVTGYIDKDNLTAFLRYNIIAETELAGPSSLLLFWSGNRDAKLLSAALIRSIDWLDGNNYFKTGELTDFIASQTSNAMDVLIDNMPESSYHGLPPGYWMMFLPTLIDSERLYINDFVTVVSKLDLLIISRYPEIRILLYKLLNDKIEYRDALRKGMCELAIGLRFRCAAILLVSNPESELKALEIILAGFVSSLGEAEWQSLCLGLNYGNKALAFIHSIIHRLTDIAQVFALTLLHYYHFSLNPNDITRLIDGLLGDGYFFDRRATNAAYKQESILSHSEYFKSIIPYFNNEDQKKAEHAALIVFEYHFAALNIQQQAQAWMLQVESYERSLFDFSVKHLILFDAKDFVDELTKFADEYERLHKKTPLLHIFYKAWAGIERWKELFLWFFRASEGHSFHILEAFYQWLLTFIKQNPQFQSLISSAISDLLEVPVYKENFRANDIYPVLILMANAFGIKTGYELQDVLNNYSASVNTEEVFCALAVRSGLDIETLKSGVSKKLYFNVFCEYDPSFIVRIAIPEIQNLLIEIEDIPDQIIEKTATILLYGNISDDELELIDRKGILARYFVATIRFSRNKPIEIDKLMNLRDIGGQKHYQLQARQQHRKILFKIIRILADESENREKLMTTLELELEIPNDEHFIENFYQLMLHGRSLKAEIFFKLLNIILERPFMIREDFAYELCIYIATNIPDSQNEIYSNEIDKHLFAMYSHFEKDGLESEYNMALWILSLASLYLRNVVNEYSRTGFLIGLQYAFLEKNSMQRSLRNPPLHFFKAGDMLKFSYPLFIKIKPALIKEIVDYGSTSNIPEISVCCHVLSALAGKEYGPTYSNPHIG